MAELDAITVVASFVLTWGIGLAPPLLIRYAILRRPINKWPAIGICALFWLFNVILFTALGSKSKTHFALTLVAFVSYWILRRGGKIKEQAMNAGGGQITEAPRTKSQAIADIEVQTIGSEMLQQSSSASKAILISSQQDTTMAANLDDEFWARALAEYESSARRAGLYARVFSQAQGNEAVAKASYLKHRVAEFYLEQQRRVQAQEHAEREAIEKARLFKLTEEQRAYELLPKGSCPSCEAVIALSAPECPKCRALFGPGSEWKVLPLKDG